MEQCPNTNSRLDLSIAFSALLKWLINLVYILPLSFLFKTYIHNCFSWVHRKVLEWARWEAKSTAPWMQNAEDRFLQQLTNCTIPILCLHRHAWALQWGCKNALRGHNCIFLKTKQNQPSLSGNQEKKLGIFIPQMIHKEPSGKITQLLSFFLFQ